MIAGQKVESENKETQDQIRVRTTMTTEPVEGMAKLKHQIAQWKAALTQTRWDNAHTSTLSSPPKWGHRCGHSGGGSNSHSDSHNGRDDPGQMIQAHIFLTECAGEYVGEVAVGREIKDTVWGERVQLAAESHSLFLKCYRCQG